MELFYDLHIHSCLSPCGNDDCTPANIAMLAQMLGLQAVALTDHNTCKNCPAFFKAAEQAGILPIAGMELTVQEEFHVLCLFPQLDQAMKFDELVHQQLLPFKNDKSIYGNQLIVDSEDDIVGEEEICLINATMIDFYSLPQIVHNLGGIIIPAHIDRSAFSMIATLGSVPTDVGFDCVEIKYPNAVDNLCRQHPYLQQCKIIHDSDAHQLEDISLPIHKLQVEQFTAKSVLASLSKRYDQT